MATSSANHSVESEATCSHFNNVDSKRKYRTWEPIPTRRANTLNARRERRRHHLDDVYLPNYDDETPSPRGTRFHETTTTYARDETVRHIRSMKRSHMELMPRIRKRSTRAGEVNLRAIRNERTGDSSERPLELPVSNIRQESSTLGCQSPEVSSSWENGKELRNEEFIDITYKEVEIAALSVENGGIPIKTCMSSTSVVSMDLDSDTETACLDEADHTVPTVNTLSVTDRSSLKSNEVVYSSSSVDAIMDVKRTDVICSVKPSEVVHSSSSISAITDVKRTDVISSLKSNEVFDSSTIEPTQGCIYSSLIEVVLDNESRARAYCNNQDKVSHNRFLLPKDPRNSSNFYRKYEVTNPVSEKIKRFSSSNNAVKHYNPKDKCFLISKNKKITDLPKPRKPLPVQKQRSSNISSIQETKHDVKRPLPTRRNIQCSEVKDEIRRYYKRSHMTVNDFCCHVVIDRLKNVFLDETEISSHFSNYVTQLRKNKEILLGSGPKDGTQRTVEKVSRVDDVGSLSSEIDQKIDDQMEMEFVNDIQVACIDTKKSYLIYSLENEITGKSDKEITIRKGNTSKDSHLIKKHRHNNTDDEFRNFEAVDTSRELTFLANIVHETNFRKSSDKYYRENRNKDYRKSSDSLGEHQRGNNATRGECLIDKRRNKFHLKGSGTRPRDKSKSIDLINSIDGANVHTQPRVSVKSKIVAVTKTIRSPGHKTTFKKLFGDDLSDLKNEAKRKNEGASTESCKKSKKMEVSVDQSRALSKRRTSVSDKSQNTIMKITKRRNTLPTSITSPICKVVREINESSFKNTTFSHEEIHKFSEPDIQRVSETIEMIYEEISVPTTTVNACLLQDTVENSNSSEDILRILEESSISIIENDSTPEVTNVSITSSEEGNSVHDTGIKKHQSSTHFAKFNVLESNKTEFTNGLVQLQPKYERVEREVIEKHHDSFQNVSITHVRSEVCQPVDASLVEDEEEIMIHVEVSKDIRIKEEMVHPTEKLVTTAELFGTVKEELGKSTVQIDQVSSISVDEIGNETVPSENESANRRNTSIELDADNIQGRPVESGSSGSKSQSEKISDNNAKTVPQPRISVSLNLSNTETLNRLETASAQINKPISDAKVSLEQKRSRRKRKFSCLETSAVELSEMITEAWTASRQQHSQGCESSDKLNNNSTQINNVLSNSASSPRQEHIEAINTDETDSGSVVKLISSKKYSPRPKRRQSIEISRLPGTESTRINRTKTDCRASVHKNNISGQNEALTKTLVSIGLEADRIASNKPSPLEAMSRNVQNMNWVPTSYNNPIMNSQQCNRTDTAGRFLRRHIMDTAGLDISSASSVSQTSYQQLPSDNFSNIYCSFTTNVLNILKLYIPLHLAYGKAYQVIIKTLMEVENYIIDQELEKNAMRYLLFERRRQFAQYFLIAVKKLPKDLLHFNWSFFFRVLISSLSEINIKVSLYDLVLYMWSFVEQFDAEYNAQDASKKFKNALQKIHSNQQFGSFQHQGMTRQQYATLKSQIESYFRLLKTTPSVVSQSHQKKLNSPSSIAPVRRSGMSILSESAIEKKTIKFLHGTSMVRSNNQEISRVPQNDEAETRTALFSSLDRSPQLGSSFETTKVDKSKFTSQIINPIQHERSTNAVTTKEKVHGLGGCSRNVNYNLVSDAVSGFSEGMVGQIISKTNRPVQESSQPLVSKTNAASGCEKGDISLLRGFRREPHTYSCLTESTPPTTDTTALDVSTTVDMMQSSITETPLTTIHISDKHSSSSEVCQDRASIPILNELKNTESSRNLEKEVSKKEQLDEIDPTKGEESNSTVTMIKVDDSEPIDTVIKIGNDTPEDEIIDLTWMDDFAREENLQDHQSDEFLCIKVEPLADRSVIVSPGDSGIESPSAQWASDDFDSGCELVRVEEDQFPNFFSYIV